MGPFPMHDMHVHSTFSDGAATIEQNAERAQVLGLDTLTLVDHVRVDTAWVPQFVAAVDGLRVRTPVELLVGVEAKILSTDGALDVPAEIQGVDRVYIADHQVPGPDGPCHPRDVAASLADGSLDAREVLDWIVDGTVNAMYRYPGGVVAHLFSVLPKIGVDEGAVTDAHLGRLATAARETDTLVEVSERWRCPSPRSLAACARAGVRIVASTDSHSLNTLGQFDWCRGAWSAAAELLGDRDIPGMLTPVR